MGNRIHIIGGGTFSHVRSHFALAAPAFGSTARYLYRELYHAIEQQVANEINDLSLGSADSAEQLRSSQEEAAHRVTLHLTKMAAPRQSNLVTNADVERLLDGLIADPDTRVIIMNAALCDFDGHILKEEGKVVSPSPSGPHEPRLKTRDLGPFESSVELTPAPKLIGKIRKDRKDIFVVGFKTTTDATSDEQYRIALDMLKRDSLNLVLANDTVTRNNMIVAPEETRYCETTDRNKVLDELVKMVLARSTNTFTRSTVKHGDSVPWNNNPEVPENLRAVVNYCIDRGAYKPFRNATAGHFAVRVDDTTIYTSKRKQNFNDLSQVGLVRVDYEGDDKVVAFGAKPSVGGQSQRIVFREHPGMDCIVHFHCPLRDPNQTLIPLASQWQNECGSHQCGANTSQNLREMPGFDGKLKAVMLDPHGPNIVFSRDVPAQQIIRFIEANFDLSAKTGGLVEESEPKVMTA